ncbi:L-selectin isoform X2 [Carassius gibelio]|uniref:L-selectin isoform X2 n=1 Tax=Carassius gibelio TaxID=101364 RepID=UPI00227839D9|nr:L-selectin isoform X2 [Carassius gibelio]
MKNILLTASDSVERRIQRSMTRCVVYTDVLIHLWLILVSVEGWTYHWKENEKMTWNETRAWCQKEYTDIVMVHNENVTRFLEKNLPEKSSSPYFWIGMKKINDIWTWAANGQSVDNENWAPTEPNNNKADENCVELYTNTNNKGKWNDDSCEHKKHPLCQKSQCPNNCTDRQYCVEQVNNVTCVCKTGFSGPECETVVSCEPLSAPPHGGMQCSGPYGNHSLNSDCTFSCAGGYKLNGKDELKCNSSGAWNAPPPSCTAECFPILLFGGGLLNCTEGHDSIRSACRVQCPPGHLLLGFVEFTCRADGTWESSFPLMCASYVHFLIALLASVVISVFCGCLFCCSSCRRSKKAVRTRPETVNPAFEAEHTPLEGPLCSA